MISPADAKIEFGFVTVVPGRLEISKTRLFLTGLVTLLAALPILIVLASLFYPANDNVEHLWSTTLPTYIINTVILMIATGMIAAMIGILTAWAVSAYEFPGRRFMSWLLVLPLAAPAYIIAYVYTDLLEYSGPIQSTLRDQFDWGRNDYWFPEIRSLSGAAFILGLVLYPYVYVLARASFSAQCQAQFQAARTLGKSPLEAFFKVILPASRPAIAGGVALVLMETLADYGVVDYFSIPTFSTGIFRTWFGLGDQMAAMKLAGIMMLFVIILIMFETMTRRGSYVSGKPQRRGVERIRVNRVRQWLLSLFCALPILFGFILPVFILISLVGKTGDNISSANIGIFLKNSLTVSAITAFVATIVAIFLIYIHRQLNSQTWASGTVKTGIRVSTLGYALPGALLAVGILGPIGQLDQKLTAFFNSRFQTDYGLLLSGSIALLVYALTLRFLTASYNSLSGGMAKISRSMDDSARTLGARPSTVLTKIHLPLLAPSLAAGACLVFIDVMRELPATLILRPFNFETLSTRVYRLASDERLAEAATAALIIIAVGILPVIVLNWIYRSPNRS